MNRNTYFEDVTAWPKGKRPHAVWPMYVSGFILSLLLTFGAYAVAVDHVLNVSKLGIIILLVILAALQFFVQLVCFFHLSFEKAARERLIIFGGVIVIVGILVSGSIWILFTLDARMMPDAAQMQQYMDTQAGL